MQPRVLKFSLLWWSYWVCGCLPWAPQNMKVMQDGFGCISSFWGCTMLAEQELVFLVLILLIFLDGQDLKVWIASQSVIDTIRSWSSVARLWPARSVSIIRFVDQIMIEQSIHDLIDLLDHRYCSIMPNHHRVYSSILSHARSLC